MKKLLPKLLILCATGLLPLTSFAQRYITNTYGYTCYNFFDDNTVDNTNSNNTTGVYAPGFAPDPNVATNNTSVVLSSAAAYSLASFTGRCLQSKYQATPKAIYSNFIPNAADATYKTINNNDWEWSFLYRSDLPVGTYPSNVPANVSTGLATNTNSWRYWLFSNNASINSNSTGGFYVTQNNAGKIVVYVVTGGASYQLIISDNALTNGKTYCIKIQRLMGGSWRMFLDEYTTSVTQAKTLQTSKTVTSDGQGITMTYVTSALEAENTNATSPSTDGAFKFDEIHMYTRYLKFTNVTSAANGVTQPPFYAGQGAVILWGTKVEMRGNYNLGINQSTDLTVGHSDSGYPQGNFSGTLTPATLYKTTNPVFSTASPTTVLTSDFYVYGGSTAQTGNSGFRDNEVTMGNTDGTLSTPVYWFLGATVNSSITTGVSISFTGVNTVKEDVNNNAVTGTVVFGTASPTTTITFGNVYDWKGTTNTIWTTTTNWSPNGNPGSTTTSTDVIRIGYVAFNTSRPPTVPSGGKVVGSVIIGSVNTGAITLNNQTLTTTSFTINPSSTLNANGGGTIKVNGTGAVSSTGVLYLNSGAILNNAGTFTFSSDASGSAALGPVTSAAQLAGNNYNVEKYIRGNNDATYRTYRFLSSPVYTSTQTLATIGSTNVYNLKYLTGSGTNFPILTGPAGGGFDKIGNPTIYVYREDRAPGSTAFSGFNYIGISNIKNEQLSYVATNNTTTAGYLPVGNGFAMFYRGSKSDLGGRTAFPGPTTPDNTTITAIGKINTGSIGVDLWYSATAANNYQSTLGYTSATANTAVRGFNLVGNPYPSTIDWETASYSSSSAGIYAPTNTFFGAATGLNAYISSTIYTFNPASKVFDTYTYGVGGTGSGSRYIASGQGFFVKVLPGVFGGTTSITFNEAAKAETQQMTAFMGSPTNIAMQLLRFKLRKDDINTDDILLRFNADGKKSYNPLIDAEDMGGIGNQVSLSSVDSTGLLMAFKNLPPITEGSKVKLFINTTASGQFSLTGSEFETLNTRYDVFLLDHFKNDSLLISKYKTYLFDVDKTNLNTYGSERFEVVFHKKRIPPYALLNFEGAKESLGAKLDWKVDNEFNYTYFELEKLNADNQYTSIYNVKSTGAGTYNFVDKNIIIGTNTYRLKQTDLDNNISYSKDVVIMYANPTDRNNSGLSVTPNPATTDISVSVLDKTLPVNTSYDVNIFNSSGNTVKHVTTNQPTWQNNVSDLLPGTYIINVINKSNGRLVGKTKFIKL